MQTDSADWRRQGRRVIYLSARTAIYSTWLLSQPGGLTATLAWVKPCVEWHSVVPTPGERASNRWHRSWRAGRFRRRRGQMTCMPLGSLKGGRLFKKGLWAGQGVCVFVFERRWLSAMQLRRGPLIPTLANWTFATHHTGRSVLWHLQTGGRTRSGLPMLFINLFSFSTTANTLVGLHTLTCTEFQGECLLIWEFLCYFYGLRHPFNIFDNSTRRKQRSTALFTCN